MDPTTKRPPLWNRNFIQCCISYFLMNIAYYVQVPTMPLYLSEELGIDNSQVGLVLSSYTIGVLCMRPFSGYLVDCFSRKYLYIFAFAMFSLFFVGYFWATTVLLLILIRLFQGTFMGLTSVSGNTITIDVIPSARRGEGLGFYGLAINIAMSLAPLIAVATYAKQGFNAVVWSSLAFSALGIFSVLFIRYPRREKVKRPPLSLDRFILLKAIPAAITYMFVAVAYGMLLSFVVLYGKEIGVANAGYFFIYMAVGVGLSRLVSGRLIDGGKIHQVAICAMSCLIVMIAIFATVHNAYVFFASAFVIGVGFGIGVPAFQCLFVNVVPHSQRGTAMGTYFTAYDLGIGIGMLTAGFISSRWVLSAAYLTGAFSCLCALITYLIWTKSSYERHKMLV